MPDHYLSGGEQTTINSTITELFPALAFNTGTTVTSAAGMQEFISSLDMDSNGAKKTFVNDSNITAAEGYITKMADIRPSMRTTKLENAVGIKRWIDGYSHQREVEKAVWGYREKPPGVPNNHAGDIFLYFKNKKVRPQILGVSLKAGTSGSKEPKMNSYVGSSLRKPAWKTAFPNALTELKNELWDEVYSQVPNLPTKGSKAVTKTNYLTINGNQRPNKTLQDKILLLFQHNPARFEELYTKMNLVCRTKFISMINDNIKGLNATKQWIREDFNLPEDDASVPLVLVKAVGTQAETQPTSVRDFLPAVTSVQASLKSGSVQEWYIELKGDNNHSLKLLMTIRSDSEYRAQKQKGKLGAFTMLKLLYRGTQ